MTLNKQKGNMYGFVTHTWNVIKGKCPHDCEYCYMKVFPQGELRFDEKELKTDLGSNNFIFVGSSCDMFADSIPDEWIKKTLIRCQLYPHNNYLFQTKNPKRFKNFNCYPPNCLFGTTIETNKQNLLNNKAPIIEERILELAEVDGRKFVTIEPIMDFDVSVLSGYIHLVYPEFVNIGADSKNHNLPEPSKEKIKELIVELEKFTKVNLKDNLSRIK